MKKVIVAAVLLLGGCATALAPYKAAVKGMADTGDQVDANCLKSPLTPGEQALVDGWRDQRKAGHALADGGK